MVAFADIQQTARLIVEKFHPDRIILFGSYAYGSPTDDSDVDILVILPVESGTFRKSVEILNKVHPPFAVDLLARDPQDAARRYAQGDPLIGEAMDRGVVLYERNCARVD